MKWISVKDRLPEEDQEVLATNGKYYHIGKMGFDSIGCGDCGYSCGIRGDETHWMPLPNAPDRDAHFEGCITLMHLCDNWPLREICEDGINCTKHPDYEILYKCVDNCPLKDIVLETAARIMEKHKETFEKLSKE